jgi:hypothetical protein
MTTGDGSILPAFVSPVEEPRHKHHIAMDRIWREFGRHLDTLSAIDNTYHFLTLVLVGCNSVFHYASIAYVALHVHSVMVRDDQGTWQGVNAGPPEPLGPPLGPSGPQASGGPVRFLVGAKFP